MTVYLAVALDLPLRGLFDYSHEEAVEVGVRVRVTFGNRALIGMVWETRSEPEVPVERVRPIEAVLDDLPPLPAEWCRLAVFAASYYHHPLGQVLLSALPRALRTSSAYTGSRAAGGPVRRADRRPALRRRALPVPAPGASPDGADVVLTGEQVDALEGLRAMHRGVAVVHGVTGSGKTALYLRLARDALARGHQVLLLVPEINLTPQLEGSVLAYLQSLADPVRSASDALDQPKPAHERLVVMHSRLSEGDRLRAWLRMARGQADILLGTRLALFTPMPRLGLIVVDEEHDSSYKQQEGLRYSARDLAIWRGHDREIPVVLCSATPSLETWRHVTCGDYRLFSLTQRVGNQALPEIRLIDTRRAALADGLSPQLLEALQARLSSGEQSLVFLNRRGYAPVLRCPACGWVSQCRHCTAHTVLHHQAGARPRLQCHHCGDTTGVPPACPECGETDLQPLGQGTQRVAASLEQQFPQARIVRIDADATRRKGSAQRLFAQVHAGEADILIGTQMVSKGHDFARLGLVGVLNADTLLFAQDFRAPERLFAQLMQVAGRAGRHRAGAQVLVQTDYPDQAVYQALLRQDYAQFAQALLSEREALGLPPFSNQALLVAQASQVRTALDFLQAVRTVALESALGARIRVYDPVPLPIVRVARIERAQLLFESDTRSALHGLLRHLLPLIGARIDSRGVRWSIEVDPVEI